MGAKSCLCLAFNFAVFQFVFGLLLLLSVVTADLIPYISWHVVETPEVNISNGGEMTIIIILSGLLMGSGILCACARNVFLYIIYLICNTLALCLNAAALATVALFMIDYNSNTSSSFSSMPSSSSSSSSSSFSLSSTSTSALSESSQEERIELIVQLTIQCTTVFLTMANEVICIMWACQLPRKKGFWDKNNIP
ncbi:hypothetical protein Pelo_1011 [Pelomyxa schiedti]|nr:hypothetical protein Pelo_1011 [Pelomyxa schiedti]